MDKESLAALMLHFYQGLSPSDIIKLYRDIGGRASFTIIIFFD